MKTLIKYITLLLVGGVIIPLCLPAMFAQIGTKANKNKCEKQVPDSTSYPSVTYMVAAKILPVLHFFQ